MSFKFSTFWVLKVLRSSVSNALQDSNMLLMSVTFSVLKFSNPSKVVSALNCENHPAVVVG